MQLYKGIAFIIVVSATYKYTNENKYKSIASNTFCYTTVKQTNVQWVRIFLKKQFYEIGSIYETFTSIKK